MILLHAQSNIDSAMDIYEDIINLERPPLRFHRPMTRAKRAAQFMPFAALRGYDDLIEEIHRMVEPKRELSDEEAADLNEKTAILAEHERERPLVRIVHFVPDKTKEGGKYETLEAKVRRVDYVFASLILEDRTKIAFENIYKIDFLADSSD